MTITAHFEEEEEPVITYELEVDSTEGGEVVEPGEWTFEYEEGEVVELEAVADEGYKFVEWTNDVENIDDVESRETTITMEDDYTITAVFEEVDMYTLTIDIDGEGTVEVAGDAVEDGWSEEYEEGTELSLEAIAEEGWQFEEWTGDVEEYDEDITITLEGDMDITAQFTEVGEAYFEVTITSPEDGAEYEEGDEIIVEYEVENIGDGPGTQDVEFMINGELIDTEEDVTLGPDEVHEGFFRWEANEEGDIELVVRTVDDDEVVESSAEVTVSVDEDEVGLLEGEGLLCSWWWLILLLIIVILILVIVVIAKRGGDDEDEYVDEEPFMETPPLDEEFTETDDYEEEEDEKELIECPLCGAELEEDTEECPKCGEPLEPLQEDTEEKAVLIEGEEAEEVFEEEYTSEYLEEERDEEI